MFIYNKLNSAYVLKLLNYEQSIKGLLNNTKCSYKNVFKYEKKFSFKN